MNLEGERKMGIPPEPHLSTSLDAVKGSSCGVGIDARTQNISLGGQMNNFDRAVAITAPRLNANTDANFTDVYDELEAYGSQDNEPYLNCVRRVMQYATYVPESITSSFAMSSCEGWNDVGRRSVESFGGSAAAENRDHSCRHKTDAPHGMQPLGMAISPRCLGIRLSDRTVAPVGARQLPTCELKVGAMNEKDSDGRRAARMPKSFDAIPLSSCSPRLSDEAIGFSSPGNAEFSTSVPRAAVELSNRVLPMNDFDVELLEIIKTYYERKQSELVAAGDAAPHREGAGGGEAHLLTDVATKACLQGSAGLSSLLEHARVLQEEVTDEESLDSSLLTPSTVSHCASQFRQPRTLRSITLRHRVHLPRSNKTNVATIKSRSAKLFLSKPTTSNRQETTCSVSSASYTHPVARRHQKYKIYRRSNTLERKCRATFPSPSSTSFVRAYVSDMNMNLGPIIVVTGLAAVLNIIIVCFLQNHVLDTQDHLGLFLTGSYLTFSSYYMVYYFLECDSRSFRRIASTERKFYIIGNLIKAGILISITPFAAYHLTKIVLYDEWESNILRNLGCIYALPDFISMIVVKRMRWSTWIHHLCVVVFNYFSIMNDYQNENIFRCVVVYAGFSSFAYCVNVLLGSRFLGMPASFARVLSFAALAVYVLCCSINWSWQVYYLLRLIRKGEDLWSVYVYLILICFVVWDDIVLNGWLWNHARNMAYTVSREQQRC